MDTHDCSKCNKPYSSDDIFLGDCEHLICIRCIYEDVESYDDIPNMIKCAVPMCAVSINKGIITVFLISKSKKCETCDNYKLWINGSFHCDNCFNESLCEQCKYAKHQGFGCLDYARLSQEIDKDRFIKVTTDLNVKIKECVECNYIMDKTTIIESCRKCSSFKFCWECDDRVGPDCSHDIQLSDILCFSYESETGSGDLLYDTDGSEKSESDSETTNEVKKIFGSDPDLLI